METPFGAFHVPNITPDPETGIGAWGEQDFVRAMRNGLDPNGRHLYPIFPYRWYRNLSDADLAAMWTFLRSIPPVRREIRRHRIYFPFSIRRGIAAWKWINLQEDASIASRGELLVRAAGHCGACHTPSLMFAYYDSARELGGDPSTLGPYAASNLTPHDTGIAEWSDMDLLRVLRLGMRPDGTPVRGDMAEYVADSTSRLSENDLRAMVGYLRQLRPIDHLVQRTPEIEAEGTVFREHSLVLSVSTLPDLARGGAIAFRAQEGCAACHSPYGPDAIAFPVLRGQSAAYMISRLEHYASSIDAHPVMSPIARGLSSSDMRDVADFYAALPPPYNVRAPLPRVLADNQRGAALALRGDPRLGVQACATCHGANGEGVAPSYPYLAGQPATYIEAQFAFWRARRRDDGPLGVMGEIARKLPPEDARAVAIYYASLAAAEQAQ